MSHLLIGQDMNLRYIPNVPAGNDIALSEGGMYVAAKRGVNEPLEIAAQVPECFDFQTWKFEVPNSSDRISILYVPQGDAAVSDVGGLGFSNASEAPGTPVTLGPPSEYDVERVAKIGDGIIVTIRPTGHMVGEDYYVGVKNNELTIIGLPTGTSEGLPGWFFFTK